MQKTGDRLSLTSLWVTFLAVSFVLSLLFQAPLFGQQNGNLYGTVNDSRGFPVSGALIEIEGGIH